MTTPSDHRAGLPARPLLRDAAEPTTSASSTYGRVSPLRRSEIRRGRRVMLQVLGTIVACTALLGFGAGMLGAQWVDLSTISRSDRAEDLVAQTIDALAAYSFDTVSSMDGSSIHDHPSPEQSDYRVDLAVTPAANGLLQIRAVLLDIRTRREVTRFVTWRGRG